MADEEKCAVSFGIKEKMQIKTLREREETKRVKEMLQGRRKRANQKMRWRRRLDWVRV